HYQRARQMAAALVKGLLQRIDAAEHRGRQFQQQPAIFRWLPVTAPAFEQLHMKVPLQGSDLLPNSRLRHAQAPGRCRKRLFPARGEECPELSEPQFLIALSNERHWAVL